ncbi:MAG: helix-turn-helix transcriptional regulator [Leptolyngbyaceae cyanobacterium SM1_3_5]|nr:helix-turn-helix transcriptional regulator [Leptolyngbyaceae cyanobacterium SM1_3_5]
MNWRNCSILINIISASSSSDRPEFALSIYPATRIERAKRLLDTSSLSLTEIAMECGFANQSHFTKYFHKYTGQTPKTYRSK